MPVGKTRKTNKHLPQRMYWKNGAHWYVDRSNKWHRLGVDYSDALKRYAALIETGGNDRIDLLIARYENEILPKRSADTAKGRKKEFKKILPVFGHMAPKDLTAADAWNYFEKRGSNQAARHEIRALSAVMGWARKWGAVSVNPLLNIGFPTFKPRDRYVTDDEFVAVRACAPLMLQYAMNIALGTAARQKDILGLDRKQVAAGILKVVQSKTGRKVNYPVAGTLEENIEAALKLPPQVRQYVIVNRKGKPYTRDGFQTQWQRAMIKAFPNKADRFTFNDIRAKSLSDAETLEEARIRAGHSNSKITQEVYRRRPEVATVMDIGHLKGTK
jgi:Phage integrase family